MDTFPGAPTCGVGARYKLQIDDGAAFPDPASRFQPEGPHGPSCVVDPFSFQWTDANLARSETRGPDHLRDAYRHIYARGNMASRHREAGGALKETGITLLEMMPIADFPGRFGWGYDGVDLFAPTRLYGIPDDLRAFVDRAHALGLGVILDVVYNHFGPDGNYLGAFSDDYLTARPRERMGRRDQFRREELRASPRIFHHQRALLD